LDGRFRPVAAIICRVGAAENTPGPPETIVVESRATNISTLLAALGLPNQPSYEGIACPADLEEEPFLALTDRRRRWVRPGMPVSACGQFAPRSARPWTRST
jgi:hypothetical protein